MNTNLRSPSRTKEKAKLNRVESESKELETEKSSKSANRSKKIRDLSDTAYFKKINFQIKTH